jgi:antitoxin (DNA-binding transcriptional repressor) of toxin-antitoxin stability system
MSIHKVTKSTFRAKMFEYIRQLQEKGGTLVITEYGKPVLEIRPYQVRQTCAEIFRDLRGKIKIDRALAIASTEAEWN